MKVFEMSETYSAARSKWMEYVDACKKYPRHSLYKDMKKVYYQLCRGKKVIDIHKVMKLTGVHVNGHPKLAIVRADQKMVHCRMFGDGSVIYSSRSKNSWEKATKEDVVAVGLPEWPNNKNALLRLTAPVPIIPPKHLPDKLTDDYYILWEVDTWTMEPPVDPYLLRRITDSFFVIIAAWDLTEVERSIMHTKII